MIEIESKNDRTQILKLDPQSNKYWTRILNYLTLQTHSIRP